MPELLNKARIRRSFRRSLMTYDEQATVQKQAGERLLDLLESCPPVTVDRVLEIGCCTGILSELFCRRFAPATFFLNDLVDEFVKAVPARLSGAWQGHLQGLPGDIEQQMLPRDLSLVISSSTFQWLVDLPTLLTRLATAIRPGGQLAISLFGPGTLSEFKALTGVGLRYRSLEAIRAILEQFFVIEVQESRDEQLFFDHPREVLHHLRATGVGGVAEFQWNKGRLRRFEQDYQTRFGTAAGVGVTYTTLFFIARRREGPGER